VSGQSIGQAPQTCCSSATISSYSDLSAKRRFHIQFERDTLREIRLGLGRFVEPQLQNPAVDIDLRVAWIEREGLVVIGQRALVIAFRRAGVRAVVLVVREERAQFDSAIAVGDGAVEIASRNTQITAIAVRRAVPPSAPGDCRGSLPTFCVKFQTIHARSGVRMLPTQPIALHSLRRNMVNKPRIHTRSRERAFRLSPTFFFGLSIDFASRANPALAVGRVMAQWRQPAHCARSRAF
jgi:hypothetical protein